MFIFKTKQIFKDEKCVGGKVAARSFRKEVESKSAEGPVTIDFEGTDLIIQGFSDEFLGPLSKYYGLKLFQQVKFKNCSDGVRVMMVHTGDMDYAISSANGYSKDSSFSPSSSKYPKS